MKITAVRSFEFDGCHVEASDDGRDPACRQAFPTICQRIQRVSPMIRMILSFVTCHNSLTLNRASFRHPLLQEERVTIRGASAPHAFGNFRWSSGVRAVALLLVKQAVVLDRRRNGNDAPFDPAAIEGHEHSVAASLDYALSKQPLWLQDMFGVSAQGVQISRLLFRRVNPDRKRPGPVIIFISNKDFDVVIEVDGRKVHDSIELQQLQERLEAQGVQVG